MTPDPGSPDPGRRWSFHFTRRPTVKGGHEHLDQSSTPAARPRACRVSSAWAGPPGRPLGVAAADFLHGESGVLRDVGPSR